MLTKPDQEQRDYDRFWLHPLQSVTSVSKAKYLNLDHVGKGGNGTTFKVVCDRGKYIGMEFALKVFFKISDDVRRKRFLTEAKTLRGLTHPGIIRLYDVGEYTIRDSNISYPFMVVEYIPESIRDILNKEAKLKQLQALRFGVQILTALDYIHTLSQPIIHRDIKPENILISGDLVKLADFGLIRTDDDTLSDLDVQGGTAKYEAMPTRYRTPELIDYSKGGPKPTTKSDVYQFGLLLYEMLTGFNPQKKAEKKTDPIELTPLRLEGAVKDELLELIANLLSNSPDERLSAKEARFTLMQLYVKLQRMNLEINGTLG